MATEDECILCGQRLSVRERSNFDVPDDELWRVHCPTCGEYHAGGALWAVRIPDERRAQLAMDVQAVRASGLMALLDYYKGAVQVFRIPEL